jgi:type IV pilus assembly protein PilA
MNKRGFTLIELLAVIVIMGIILAIAVPSTVGIIDKSKRETHVKNAQILTTTVNTILMLEEEVPINDGDAVLYTIGYLIENGHLPDVKDPDGGDYGTTNTFVVAVKKDGVVKFYVQLDGSERDTGIDRADLEETMNMTADYIGKGTIKNPTVSGDQSTIKSRIGASSLIVKN